MKGGTLTARVATLLQRRHLIVMLTCAIGLLFIALAFIQYAVELSNKNKCRAQLKWLGEALCNYRDCEDHFPPASIVGANGQPMHSWRVLLVPYLEKNSFYNRYDLHEPWDGPNNQLLLRECYEQSYGKTVDITNVRQLYQCPSAPASEDPYRTNYVMVVDPNEPTAEIRGRGLRFGVKQGCRVRLPVGGEVMVVEIHNSDIHWMEPRDLSLDEMSFLINDPNKPSISSPHVGGAFVLKKDGTVEFLDKDTTEERLREMLQGN